MAGGPENATEELLALRDAMPPEGGTIDLAGRELAYTDERWLVFGDRNVVIEGNGAVLTSQAPNGAPIAPLGHGPIVWGEADGSLGHRIAVAQPGDRILSILDPAPGHYQPGDIVLVAGYIQQVDPADPSKPWGWPPNFRYFEYHTVVEASDRAATLSAPLRFAYDTTWPEFEQDIFGVRFTFGAPRVWRWRHDDGRAPTRSLTIRNATFRGGSLGTHSFRHLRLESCTVETANLWPAMSQRVEFVDCTLAGMEPDKIVESITLSGGEVLGRLGGTGAGFLSFQATSTHFHQFVQLVGRSVAFDACRFGQGVHLATDGALPPGDQPPVTLDATGSWATPK